jgi:glycosyltransferase involved in cell wall biosynthesis
MARIAAVVPAHNEAPRIAGVLRVLCAMREIGEVIVVDDGSDDGLRDAVRGFPKVRYLKNRENRGKGYCLERAARASDAPILLFCDADLDGLTPEMVRRVLAPVRSGTHDMFVGIFSTPVRHFFDPLLTGFRFPGGMCSGLRALRRPVWRDLPRFYKRSFYVEMGLNYLVAWRYREPGWARLRYTQTIKERKYGLVRGTLRRWRMGAEILLVILRVHAYEKRFGFGRAQRR